MDFASSRASATNRYRIISFMPVNSTRSSQASKPIFTASGSNQRGSPVSRRFSRRRRRGMIPHSVNLRHFRIGLIVPGERWDDRAQPIIDYFLAFEQSFNRFPGFNYEVQGVYQERSDKGIEFHTYVVRE